MTVFKDSYPVLKSYEKFKELICERGSVLLQETEESYCERFRTCEAQGLKPSKTLKESNPLLSGRFDRFVDLLESIFEVGYYWKRLTETARLLESSVPETLPQQIDEASWFIYNLDFYWHSEYGLQERLIRFLTIFKRMYKSPSPEEAELLNIYIKGLKRLTVEGVKTVRDPLAHFRSQGVQKWRNGHRWEAALLSNDKSDIIEIYDKHDLQYNDSYSDNILKWISEYGETLSVMFDKLCTFAIDGLELE